MPTMKKVGEIGPEMFHFEGIRVGSNNYFGNKQEKKKLKSKEPLA